MLANHERLHALRGFKFFKRLTKPAATCLQHALCDVQEQLFLRVGVGRGYFRCSLQPTLAGTELTLPNQCAADHFERWSDDRFAPPAVAFRHRDGFFAVSTRDRERMDLSHKPEVGEASDLEPRLTDFVCKRGAFTQMLFRIAEFPGPRLHHSKVCQCDRAQN